MVNRKKQFIDLFKSIDNFGSPFFMQIKGGDKSTTIYGSVMSLLIYLIVAFYAVDKFGKLRNRLDTSFQQNIEKL